MWINAAGEQFWVKYHFKTDQGIEFFTQDEGDQMAAVDTDYHTRDLFEHIRDGELPSWTLYVQIMPFEDAKTYRFNPFDLTKVWPHGDYPLIEVGRMTLDRNPTDYHTEIEQAAFEPNNLVPGIGPSPDKMLLGRLFSYADAHRYRIGVELQAAPGERARRRRSTRYTKDGAMRIHNGHRPGVRAQLQGRPGRRHRALRPTSPPGTPTARSCAPPTRHAEDDDWGQAGTLVRDVLDDAARDRLVDNVVGHLLNGVSEPVLQRAFTVLAQRRQTPRRPHRGGRARQGGRHGPEGRGAGQPGPVEHAGESLGD